MVTGLEGLVVALQPKAVLRCHGEKFAATQKCEPGTEGEPLFTYRGPHPQRTLYTIKWKLPVECNCQRPSHNCRYYRQGEWPQLAR